MLQRHRAPAQSQHGSTAAARVRSRGLRRPPPARAQAQSRSRASAAATTQPERAYFEASSFSPLLRRSRRPRVAPLVAVVLTFEIAVGLIDLLAQRLAFVRRQTRTGTSTLLIGTRSMLE